MKRNQAIIVKETGNCYEIFLSQKSADDVLYYSVFPCQDFQPLAKISGNYMVLPNPAPGKRLFFGLKSRNRIIYAAPLFMPMTATENLRDMGGYLTKAGKTVKWGQFYRSGALLPANDIERGFLDSMGLKTILDYRSSDEISRNPDYVPEGAVCLSIPAFDASEELKMKMKNMDMVQQLKAISSPADVQIVTEEFKGIYKTLPFGNPSYQTMFDLLDDNRTPFVQHCSAGKDRTGVGCALLLLALGVDEETVIGDYCLSALYRQETNQKYITHMEQQGLPDFMLNTARMLLSVRREFIVAALREIRSRYPDYETFFKEEYHITKNRLNHWADNYLVENNQK